MAINVSSVCGRVWITALSMALAACGVAKAPPGWPAGEARPINLAPASKAPK
jgi:hypothetical protein